MHPVTPLVVSLAALFLVGCTGGGQAGSAGRAAPQPERRLPTTRVGDNRTVDVAALTEADTQEMERAWRLFVEQDPRWGRSRDAWVAKGPAARQILAENLFRYFWSATKAMRKDAVARVGQEAAHVPDESVLLFGDLLALDKWPLHEATTAKVFDPDNASRPATVTVTHLGIDDVTRQNTAMVLALIGPRAVPVLSRQEVLGGPRPQVRTYAYYALGTIGNDEAVSVLEQAVAGRGDWKDRGAAAKALGFALDKNPRAREALERAAQDKDPFVRKKAEEALAGKSRWEV